MEAFGYYVTCYNCASHHVGGKEFVTKWNLGIKESNSRQLQSTIERVYRQ